MAKTKNPNLMYPRSVETTGHYLNFYAYDYNKAQSLGVKSMRDMLAGSQQMANEQLQEEMQNHQIGRFGDPEVMNVLQILKSDFLEICFIFSRLVFPLYIRNLI